MGVINGRDWSEHPDWAFSLHRSISPLACLLSVILYLKLKLDIVLHWFYLLRWHKCYRVDLIRLLWWPGCSFSLLPTQAFITLRIQTFLEQIFAYTHPNLLLFIWLEKLNNKLVHLNHVLRVYCNAHMLFIMSRRSHSAWSYVTLLSTDNLKAHCCNTVSYDANHPNSRPSRVSTANTKIKHVVSDKCRQTCIQVHNVWMQSSSLSHGLIRPQVPGRAELRWLMQSKSFNKLYNGQLQMAQWSIKQKLICWRPRIQPAF